MNLKITALIFLLMAILMTIFPPFNWGEERLQTENERNKLINWGLDQKAARDALPLKERAFLFGETKHEFRIKDPSPNIVYESKITLNRKLAVQDLILEYLFAALLGILAGWLIPKIRFSGKKHQF